MIRLAPVFSLALLVSTSAPLHAQRPAKGIVPVRIETDRGVIDVELDSARAPVTVTNFLRYVDAGAYNNGRFHRTVTPNNQPRDSVRIEVIQGGPNPDREGARWPAIPLERTNVTGLTHVDGAISMARGGPDTATSDFFICVGAQPSLDFGGHRNLDGQGFAAFGRVTRGMDIVRTIQQQPATGTNPQTLTPPVRIQRISRVAR
ncbi:MAG: peptidylprolyl isomerase [Gemmatimonadaceae bacterium]|nr:peptidylprolyl isomerase [Gemmatimonadaceae bacterium]